MQHIDDLFKDKLGREGLTPSDAAWQKIANSGVIGKKQHKGAFFIFQNQYRKYAAAIAMLMIAGAGWLIVKQDKAQNPDNFPLVHNIPENESPEMKDLSLTHISTSAEKEIENPTAVFTQENSVKRHPIEKVVNTHSKSEARVSSLTYASVNTLPVLNQNLKTKPMHLPVVQLQDTEEWYEDDIRYYTAEELMYAADQLEDVELEDEQELGLKQRLFKKAKNTLTDWAETAGVPVRQIGGISQIEILY